MITIELACGNTLTSILTSGIVHNFGLGCGIEVSTVIKASSVLLAIP